MDGPTIEVKNKEGPKGKAECDLVLGKGVSWEDSVVEAWLPHPNLDSEHSNCHTQMMKQNET